MQINKKLYAYLLTSIILINFIGIFSPILRNDDPALYANIAKIIAQTNNWRDLTLFNTPWLDKPHFPFWVIALFFKIFGINSFAYNFSGFIFHIIGGIYTYKLAKYIYNKEVAQISILIFLTSMHLLISSSIDLRAEAFLLGEIMPACYYWLIYDEKFSFKPLILASIFTAMAIMTKGIFVSITIFSGLIFTWLYTGRIRIMLSKKWLLGYVLSFIFIFPELICLYLQFDAHPEIKVFGQYNVSGLRWFFWDSQFGRFFNFGPIVNTNGNPFFFFHSFLWAFLPWSIIFAIATYSYIKRFKLFEKKDKAKIVYLFASFWLTFLMFSATKFQLDHYTNIIMPFSAIICARYITTYYVPIRKIALTQNILGGIVLIASIILTLVVFNLSVFSLFILLPLSILIIYWTRYINNMSYLEQIIVFPSVAMLIVFSFILMINNVVCKPYDSGYNIATIINQYNPSRVYDYKTGLSPLGFYTNTEYILINSKKNKISINKGDFIVISKNNWIANSYIDDKVDFNVRHEFCGNTFDKVIKYYSDKKTLQKHLNCYVIAEKIN